VHGISHALGALARADAVIEQDAIAAMSPVWPPARWLPPKAAAHDAGVRKWTERGLIEARREGKQWIGNVVSLKARKERLEGRVSVAKQTSNAPAEPFRS